MSDHYLFHINMALRADIPAPLAHALTTLAQGMRPERGALDGLPGIVQDYLCSTVRPATAFTSLKRIRP